jgi:hypothetical protein
MTPDHSHADPVAVQARRKRAARTAWLAAAVALAVYAGFILTGVLGR